MDELKPTPAEIDTLKKFPFLENCLINRLKELPSYSAAVEDVSCDVDVAKWWNNFCVVSLSALAWFFVHFIIQLPLLTHN